MRQFLLSLLLLGLLSACGGGGGGSSSSATSAPEPEPTNPEPEPIALAVIDGIPLGGVNNFDPQHSEFSFTHIGHSDLTVSFTGDCNALTGTTVRRELFDFSTLDFNQILDHKLRCDFQENTQYSIDADGTRSNDATFRATHRFATGLSNSPGINIIDQFALPRSFVDDMFLGYIEGALLSELDLSPVIEALVMGIVIELAEDSWSNLVDPDALYHVASQRVSYLSTDPGGEPDAQLTGLITFPAATQEFTPRDRMIVLTHATGSTPGDLELNDAWYILANLFASRGYLVIAPDNYGRGGTDRNPETYLMANRTAHNARDMITQVLDDTAYDDVYAGTDITIIGYSQGGHSAIGLWQLLEIPGKNAISTREVYAGGAPHNLYQTFRGVLQHLDGQCNDGEYCRHVDSDVTVPFATNRILPGFLSYTDTGLMTSDVINGDEINTDFITGFLADEPPYDKLKALLQLSSFTDISSIAENLEGTEALVHLYHSEFDRLVPLANTEELNTNLSEHVTVNFHRNLCNGDGYEIIFNLTDKVGVLHTLCGLAVLDDAMDDLK